MIIIKGNVAHMCIHACAMRRTDNLPTVDTVMAVDAILEVDVGDRQSENGSIQFLRISCPDLNKRYHFREQSFSTS